MILNVPSGGPGDQPGAPAVQWADPHWGAQHAVRQDILTSWQRCLVAGLRPDRFEVPYQPDVDDDGPLRWAAAPILDQVASDLEGTGVGLLLADARGQVVDRRAADTGILTRLDHIELAPGFLYSEDLIGTNAIGTAITQQGPSVVTGTEHFADALTAMACAATPVTDGAGQVIGVIDLTCAAEDFNPMLLPFAKRAAWEIGHRFREGARPRSLPARGWPSLTDTERAVAHLAAQGLPSRVVADRLLLSQHTVRAHLRHVFRKLGVRSRVELARVTERAAAQAHTIAAVDDARRRIERDLHDGLQQRLVTLGLQVRAAEVSVPPSDAELKWELTRVAEGLMGALQDVRDISRGIHPAILSERGLEPALKALARRSPVPVSLNVRVPGRLPDRVEASAYFIVSEALANVAKHANARMVEVFVEAGRYALSLSVRDDGVGGADPDGSGLIGLRERAEALGGTLELTSPPGRGTSVHVRLPLIRERG
jgi:signal transduction histidine kinase